MVQTMREYLTEMANLSLLKQGMEEGVVRGWGEGAKISRKEALRQALPFLREAMRKRGVEPEDYEQDLQGLSDVAEVAEMIVEFMTAKEPRAYLRERFGH